VSAASVTVSRIPAPVERRWSRRPGGIEVQTWRLVETRMLPQESAQLPLAVLFDDDGEAGAVPIASNDQADTLETPPGDEITRETTCTRAAGAAADHRDGKTEKP
jgi:hypothetical protein